MQIDVSVFDGIGKPENDLSFYLGEYELSMPWSLFSADDVIYQDKDTSVVAEKIQKSI